MWDSFQADKHIEGRKRLNMEGITGHQWDIPKFYTLQGFIGIYCVIYWEEIQASEKLW